MYLSIREFGFQTKVIKKKSRYGNKFLGLKSRRHCGFECLFQMSEGSTTEYMPLNNTLLLPRGRPPEAQGS